GAGDRVVGGGAEHVAGGEGRAQRDVVDRQQAAVVDQVDVGRLYAVDRAEHDREEVGGGDGLAARRRGVVRHLDGQRGVGAAGEVRDAEHRAGRLGDDDVAGGEVAAGGAVARGEGAGELAVQRPVVQAAEGGGAADQTQGVGAGGQQGGGGAAAGGLVAGDDVADLVLRRAGDERAADEGAVAGEVELGGGGGGRVRRDVAGAQVGPAVEGDHDAGRGHGEAGDGQERVADGHRGRVGRAEDAVDRAAEGDAEGLAGVHRRVVGDRHVEGGGGLAADE